MASSWSGLLKDWGLAMGVVFALLIGWNYINAPATGGPAPALSLLDTGGSRFNLAEQRGKVVVINFWATWCGPCRAEIPDLAKWHLANPDVPMYGVSTDDKISPPKLQSLATRFGINYPVLLDDGASNAWGIDSIPTTYVIDAEGRVSSARVGVIDDVWLDKAVAKARGG